jgi:hypothetical protein
MFTTILTLDKKKTKRQKMLQQLKLPHKQTQIKLKLCRQMHLRDPQANSNICQGFRTYIEHPT